jgi:hypothetical protein
MLSSPYTIYFWTAYVLVMSMVIIWTGVLVFKKRDGLAWALLLSGLAWGVFSCLSQVISLGWQWGWWSYDPESGQYIGLMEITWSVSAIGALVFHIALLLYARRGNTGSQRIAELEALIESHMTRRDEAAVKSE